MNDTSNAPSLALDKDAATDKAPDPRRHYSSPEDLREDIDQRLAAEAEGMSASDPISEEKESRLANEHRRVNRALDEISSELNQVQQGDRS